MVPTPSLLNKNKVIMIICDGMRYDTAFQEFGYVNSLCDNSNIGIRTVSVADSPSVSKTNYETLHTGIPALIHGITSNLIPGKSKMERNVFSELTKNGKTTGVVGSSWFYDLYGKDKYFYLTHKEINKEDGEDITWGRFFSDDVPDAVDDMTEGLAHTFQLSDHMIYKHGPDFLLIHVMTPDDTGHLKGIGKEYSNCIGKIDSVFGATLPRWLDLGYDIIITSDHGMDINHSHGGSKCDEMLSPFYVLSKKDWKPISKDEKMDHTKVAPMIIDRVLGDNDYKLYIQQVIDNNPHYHNTTVNCLK